MRRGVREVDSPARSARLHGHEVALVSAVVDLDGHRIEVDVAIAKGEQLALAKSGQRGVQNEIAVRRDRVGGQLLDLVPFEEAHLRLIPPRWLDAEDALVDEVPTLLRVREHLLEHPQCELGLAWCVSRGRGDVILNHGRADLVEVEPAEDVEVWQDLACSRER
jgi:hypothetical protein